MPESRLLSRSSSAPEHPANCICRVCEALAELRGDDQALVMAVKRLVATERSEEGND